nr:MAG TPA: hypothetical protein [Caudoviricetes sp.]
MDYYSFSFPSLAYSLAIPFILESVGIVALFKEEKSDAICSINLSVSSS